MSYRTIATVLLLLFFSRSGLAIGYAADKPDDEFQKLVEEYEGGREPRELAPKFFELAERYPTDPVAVNAMDWVLKKLRNRPEGAQALERLSSKQLESEWLAAAFPQVAKTPLLAAEKLLRVALQKSPHENVRAQACLHLGLLLDQQAAVLQQLHKKPDDAARVLEYYGQEYGQYLAKLDPQQLDKVREETYDRMLKLFAAFKYRDTTLGQLADKQLFQIRHLSTGRVAADIQGEDILGKAFKLSDYRRKVVMLSFWGHW